MNLMRIWFVGLFAALGTLFALEAADVLDAGNVIGDWWPTALIAAGALQLAVNRPFQWQGPTVLMVVGALVLSRTTGLIDESGPILISIGFFVVAVVMLSQVFGKVKPISTADRVNSFVAFGGTEVASHSKHFEGGTVGSVFGGTELDLRDAELAPDAEIDVFTAFGGTEIFVPYGWRVEMRGVPVFGGFENATKNDRGLAEDAPVLSVDATALFGAVEVKH